jgi:NAD(P)-dependent dehydrogenase (short-subunit alcohol dehydrogenase family)
MSDNTFRDKAVIVTGASSGIGRALAAEFGQQWADYCRRAPGWLPHFWHR